MVTLAAEQPAGAPRGEEFIWAQHKASVKRGSSREKWKRMTAAVIRYVSKIESRNWSARNPGKEENIMLKQGSEMINDFAARNEKKYEIVVPHPNK